MAVCGQLVKWLRDNLLMITSAAETESLALSVGDSCGVVIVPAFNGLFAPHWRSDARGVIVGLTSFADRRHIARAALEAAAFQTFELMQALEADVGHPLPALRVDGGMTANRFLMQFQADILQKQVRHHHMTSLKIRSSTVVGRLQVVRPVVSETTSLGAAFVAGLAVGFWARYDALFIVWMCMFVRVFTSSVSVSHVGSFRL